MAIMAGSGKISVPRFSRWALDNYRGRRVKIQKGFEVRLASMLLVFATTLLAGFSVMADELIMKDGSRLMGKVLKEDGGVVDFETSYAGVIKLTLKLPMPVSSRSSGVKSANLLALNQLLCC